MNKDITRREFVKGTVAASVAIAGGGLLAACGDYKSNGLPTAILGKTGVQIPRMGIGLGSRWCSIADEDVALDMLSYALDNGLYYWDTAHTYENRKVGFSSEERIGKLLKHRRKEVFISTKISTRDPEEAKRNIEKSLKRLQVDQLDMLKVHNVQGGADLESLKGDGKLIEIIHKAKEEGLTKHIGFSGHTEAAALKYMVDNYDFDSMLMALNHWNAESGEKRQEMVVPAAHKKGMGVMLMKVFRPRENDNTLSPQDLIRYGLSVKEATGIVLGMDSKQVVDSNLEILRSFKSMSSQEMDKLTARLAPFYKHENLPWMEHGYEDGNWQA